MPSKDREITRQDFGRCIFHHTIRIYSIANVYVETQAHTSPYPLRCISCAPSIIVTYSTHLQQIESLIRGNIKTILKDFDGLVHL